MIVVDFVPEVGCPILFIYEGKEWVKLLYPCAGYVRNSYWRVTESVYCGKSKMDGHKLSVVSVVYGRKQM